VGYQRKALPLILTNITSSETDERDARFVKNSKLEAEHIRVACYPKSKLLAAVLITASGEFVLTHHTPPTDPNLWIVCHHPERLDLSKDRTSGFFSMKFSESRALALDRRGNLLVMDLVWA
jgi:hypothetical protein